MSENRIQLEQVPSQQTLWDQNKDKVLDPQFYAVTGGAAIMTGLWQFSAINHLFQITTGGLILGVGIVSFVFARHAIEDLKKDISRYANTELAENTPYCVLMGAVFSAVSSMAFSAAAVEVFNAATRQESIYVSPSAFAGTVILASFCGFIARSHVREARANLSRYKAPVLANS